ncbi:MAG: guanylate kinase [Chloroflexota bacterium]
MAKPLLFVLSGLSGAGKDAVLARMRQSGFPIEFITTATTRPKRVSESRTAYRFTSPAKFQEMIAQGELLEWAQVYGNWYGVPREAVKQALEMGRDTIVKVDVQGAASIKKLVPQAVFVFLATTSMEELAARLKQRRTETPAELELRLSTAAAELKQLPLFDYIVFNRRDDVDRAVAEIEAIITAEKRRVIPRDISL